MANNQAAYTGIHKVFANNDIMVQMDNRSNFLTWLNMT